MADENEWQFLRSDDLSGGAGDNVEVDFTGNEKKLLQSLFFSEPTGNAGISLTFDNDGGSKYASRESDNGAADGTSVSQTHVSQEQGIVNPEFIVTDIVDISGEEILGISHVVDRGTAGAANAPNRREQVFKSTVTAPISIIDMTNDETGSYDTKTSLDVAGAD